MKKLSHFSLILLANLLLLATLLEASFSVYYFMQDGTWITVKEKLAREKSSFDIEKQNSTPCNKHNNVLHPHPYLVFVHAPRPECNSHANNTGHRGPHLNLTANPDEYRVMILGGSVANQVYQFSHPLFYDYFQSKFPNKKITILNGALEGWKQPQQLFMLNLYGDAINAAISIEGYNEITMNKRLDYNQRFDTPFLQGYRKANKHFLNYEEKTVIYINSLIFDFMNRYWLTSHSKTLYFLSTNLRTYFEKEALISSNPLGGINHLIPIFKLPDNWSNQDKFQYHLESYGKYLNLMKSSSDYFSIPLAIFLQPTPAAHKELTNTEQRSVRDVSYLDDYNELEKTLFSGASNQSAGRYSLTEIFKFNKNTLYRDNIHFHKESGATDLIAEQIITIIEQSWYAQKNLSE